MKTSSIAMHALIAASLLANTGGVIARESAAAPAASPSLAAQNGIFAFPAKGQDAVQQAKDESECYDWTKAQTGHDPAAPKPVEVAKAEETDSGPSGERVKGAARGAAAGAVIGEVADDDASEGAKVGAAAGVVAGGHRTRKARRDQREQAEQQVAADTKAAEQQRTDTFKRGFSGCLESRGYTVK